MKLTFLSLSLSLLGALPALADVPPLPRREPAPRKETVAVAAADDETKGVVTVKIGNELFTELHYREYAKPILAPVNGPGGVKMTRQWPMGDALPGEATDHPHHKGLWFTHGAVNGTDFWA
ncbi:MAG TPA: DUF6807 family protein, partial [Verrucomicrobiales bacterium]|nr:DUF6807 family protein [Verrucomicrobiales bacterium]